MSVSNFMLERYATGDLTEAERAIVEAELARNPEAKSRVETLKREQASFLADMPFEHLEAAQRHAPERDERITIKIGSQGMPFPWLRLAFPSLGLAGFVVAVSLFVHGPVHGPADQIKGAGVGLRMALVTGETPRMLGLGDQVHPGDRIQPAYDAAEHRFVALVGVDPQGDVSVYFPADKLTLGAIPGGPHGLFPFSLTLDDELGVETFVAVFADKPLPLTVVTEAVGKGSTPAGAIIVTVPLEKVQ